MNDPKPETGPLSQATPLNLEGIVAAFDDAWQRGEGPAIEAYLARLGSQSLAILCELVHLDLEQRIKAGEPARVEDYLARFPALAEERSQLVELLAAEFTHRQLNEPDISPEALVRRFQHLAPDLRQRCAQLARAAKGTRSGRPRQRDAANAVTVSPAQAVAGVAAPADGPAASFPEKIGRYKAQRLLGQGGFGLVFLAYDEQLDRRVAVKVPHARLVSRPEDAQAYLAEARTVANLDHPHIVPVYDIGGTDEFPCYVVSKFIEGADLATKLKQQRLNHWEAAELVATVADALHYAHKQGLVHRDVKPGNILIGSDGKPYVVDFGLALREENIGQGPKHVGTPAYMSPEQARGEGHRVDGRSDIFSLGVVLYELLVGRKPFRAESQIELLEQIASFEPRPPRQYDDQIPKELERICLKALSKRASERYSTAKDMADDLRQFQSQTPPVTSGTRAPDPAVETDTKETALAAITPSTTTPSESRPIRIVPKGLRSFDAHDADFFLELLPGPRDRDGLPDSIRFWKTRIEEPDADNTFSVGLIYGPSGCGKSSLMKAGLLPRLSGDLIAVYVEATAEETETRLLNGLRKRCPALPDNLPLKETLAALRRGQGRPSGKKVLIVLDQFEQWLHAKKEEQNSELVQALRQCDGGRVQAVVMVRDDFWLAVSRFLNDLEVDLIPGRNVALVDVFEPRHARKVLLAFGRAFGALPEGGKELSKDQNAFLDQVVAGLAQDGKIISVRLALFAEMVKGKPWTSATLKEIGGTEGVGVTFLEETFTAATANPKHRLHQKAAQAVLKALLPERGTDIKGHMRSQQDLLEASGYASRRKDFDDLIRILDSDIRLITPTDPDESSGGTEGALVQGSEVEKAEGKRQKAETQTSKTQDLKPKTPSSNPKSKIENPKWFQLTHDYLVPSLRDWLTRKQRETRRGRAELRLAERSAAWNARPENRQLPSWFENLNIRLLTDRRNWSAPQRKMMGQAARTHGLRSLIVVAVLIAAIAASVGIRNRALENQNQTRADGLVKTLMNADADKVPQLVTELDDFWRWAAPSLEALAGSEPKTADDRRARLHARLALVSHDERQVHPLVEELLAADESYLGVIRDELAPFKEQVQSELWELLHDEAKDRARRFHAGLALATYATASEQWTPADATFIAEQLVDANLEDQPRLRDYLRPLDDRLLADLERIFVDAKASLSHQLGAANALADFAGKDTVLLARHLTVATPEQYAILYPHVADAHDPAARVWLTHLLREAPAAELKPVDRQALGQRRAGAAITLLLQGEREAILDVLPGDSGGGLRGYDPELLTQFVHRCRRRGVSPGELLECLKLADQRRQPKTGEDRRLGDRVLYGLLLALGEFEVTELPQAQRDGIVEQLAHWHANDPSSAVHGATGWLLRHWNQDELARKVDQTAVDYSPDREWYTLKIEPHEPEVPARNASTDDTRERQINPKSNPGAPGQNPRLSPFYLTFVIFPPGEFLIGSPPNEPKREGGERRHAVTLTRPIAVSDREITWEQFDSFDLPILNRHDAWQKKAGHTLTAVDPVHGVSWYEAVAYCRWLTKSAGMSEDDQAYADPASLDRARYPADPNPTAGDMPRNWPMNLRKRGFRLPTEAEWEIVCRAGTNTAYSFGDDVQLLGNYGWFVLNSGNWSHVVGRLRPSPRGLFDMQGNLYEWCHDWLVQGYGTEPAVEDPTGPAEEPTAEDPNGDAEGARTKRGGCWEFIAPYCRSADRDGMQPTVRQNFFGFRVAVVPFTPPEQPSIGDPSPARAEP
jgi:eukaryotic-like serine/threonine-protein kinase